MRGETAMRSPPISWTRSVTMVVVVATWTGAAARVAPGERGENGEENEEQSGMRAKEDRARHGKLIRGRGAAVNKRVSLD